MKKILDDSRLGRVAFFWGCFLYGLVSKLYSWNKTRIKRHGILSWVFVGAGQGAGIFLLTVLTVTNQTNPIVRELRALLLPALSMGFLVLGVFPLTQIYQHREDARRKDLTLSLMLGIQKTFVCAAVRLVTAIGGFV